MKYFYIFNENTKQYDVFYRTYNGQIIYDCSFNIKAKAETYCNNMSN